MLLNLKTYCINLLAATLTIMLMPSCKQNQADKILDSSQLAQEHFKEDAKWYQDNIPFFECSDKQIEQVYYYRWKLYKAHIRNVGKNKYVITEFINDMDWDIDPYSTINAASMHHIYEGRWLKDNRYMDGYINYLYQDGGNNRQYSESIADASYARYLVNGDASFLVKQLDSMKRIFNGWYDHYDSSKNLYYIPAMPDATEYTIASIDASGGKDGFAGGEAFRPTINSYMYGNALAISRIAALNGDTETSKEYLQKANEIRTNVLRNLWNDSMQHFADRYKQDNQYVHYWDFIRGRELAGMAPWYFNLPDSSPKYNAAWKHVVDTTYLLGKYGLRTNEPSYQYYFTQFTFSFGKPGSQWNGPSWPYQSSQAIHAMGNFLQNYTQNIVSNSDYVKQLRLFTQQHILPDGTINLVENYEPNKGGPIVFFYWSNHYNHSSYNDLVISGLCGIQPSASNRLTIHPLIDSSIKYFCISDLQYHGHSLSVVYDKEGTKYKFGKGLTVLVDGKIVISASEQSKAEVEIGAPIQIPITPEKDNYALNIWKKGFPAPTASVNTVKDTLFQAIDGKKWYFKEISNYWSTDSTFNESDWYALDFGKEIEISSVNLSLYTDGKRFDLPETYSLEYRKGDQWIPFAFKAGKPIKLIGNTTNTIELIKQKTIGIRFSFRHPEKAVALAEFECY